MGEVGGRRLIGVDHRAGAGLAHLGQRVVAAGGNHIAADDRIGLAGGDANSVDILGLLGDADVGQHRAVLLGQTRHIEDRDALALKMRGHAENLADRDDAGSADAGEDDAIGTLDRWNLRLGEGGRGLGNLGRLAPARDPAMDRHETRAEAVNAGIVLVAARLVDGPLAPKFGFQRDHRNAVRDLAAIAATLADPLVDEDAPGRIVERPALAPAALLGGTCLIVDQRRDALELAQILLNGI